MQEQLIKYYTSYKLEIKLDSNYVISYVRGK